MYLPTYLTEDQADQGREMHSIKNHDPDPSNFSQKILRLPEGSYRLGAILKNAKKMSPFVSFFYSKIIIISTKLLFVGVFI